MLAVVLAYEREGVEQAQLTIHADRGTAATSKTGLM